MLGQADDFKTVAANEKDAIKERRKANRAKEDAWFVQDGNLFGIALSGGGIRAATVAYGFLEVLHQKGLLEQADYISSVSGGGYTHAYLQNVWHAQDLGKDASLFDIDHTRHIKEHRQYLVKNHSFIYKLRLGFFFLFSWAILSLPLILSAAIIYKLAKYMVNAAGMGSFFQNVPALRTASFWQQLFLGRENIPLCDDWRTILTWILLMLAVVFIATNFPGSHKATRRFITAGAFIAGMLLMLLAAHQLKGDKPTGYSILFWGIGLFLCGFFINPNRFSMHAFYREGLAKTFMDVKGAKNLDLLLKDLLNTNAVRKGPYPLFNGCLEVNIAKQKDSPLVGDYAVDYFLFSPLAVGAKLTGYKPAKDTYSQLRLATVMAACGAAANPSVGIKTNGLFRFFASVFNIRLGYWMKNPARETHYRTPLWPCYLLREPFGRVKLDQDRICITDGGHIENLGIYALLQRKCKLIVALDAAADPHYKFDDLRNLVIRARNDLGLDIQFRQDPEKMIRPMASKGYSHSNFVIADIRPIEGNRDYQGFAGQLIYFHSSVRQQMQFLEKPEDIDNLSPKEKWAHRSWEYKRRNPAFPHETTLNQFFSETQWEAYYHLGRHMADDALTGVHLDNLNLSALFQALDGIKDDETLLRLYQKGHLKE